MAFYSQLQHLSPCSETTVRPWLKSGHVRRFLPMEGWRPKIRHYLTGGRRDTTIPVDISRYKLSGGNLYAVVRVLLLGLQVKV